MVWMCCWPCREIVRWSQKTCSTPGQVAANHSFSSVLATSSRNSNRPCPLLQVRACRQSRQSGGGLAPEEPQILLQGGWVGLGEQHVIAAKAVNVSAARPLGVQGISGHDAPRDLRRGQEDGFHRNLVAFVGNGRLRQDYAHRASHRGSPHAHLALIWGGM